MVRHTLKILQHLLAARFLSISDLFWTICIGGLIVIRYFTMYPVFTYLKSTMSTKEKCVKFVQS